MATQRLFSGIQPSGIVHIGNYFGAIKNWVALQSDHGAIFCVVDLHAITVPQKPEELRRNIINTARMYLAAGIDPHAAAIFVQSHVKEHTELAWILNTIAKVTELERMTQFKDKSQRESKEGINAGLLTYPTLMAADILLYDTQVVPVGDDQVQHVELTRTLARRFNEKFGDTFVVPEAHVQKEGKRIMGLDDPTKKMSKSASSVYNYIALTDDADTVSKKIKKAVTDSGNEVVYSDGPMRSDPVSDYGSSKPALRNLINIYSLLSDKSPQEIVQMYKWRGYADFKGDLTDVINDFLAPLQKRMADISDADILDVLKDGAEKAHARAAEKMEKVRQRIGLV